MAYGAKNLAAICLDDMGCRALHGVAESIVGHQKEPTLLALVDQGDRCPMCKRIGIVGPMRAVRRALLARQISARGTGRLACDLVDKSTAD